MASAKFGDSKETVACWTRLAFSNCEAESSALHACFRSSFDPFSPLTARSTEATESDPKAAPIAVKFGRRRRNDGAEVVG